jgi:hypothetical protein
MEIVETIGRDKIQYLHLGADEVFNLGSCHKCKLFVAEAGQKLLYSQFIRRIVKKLDLKLNSKAETRINFILWDDMYRRWSLSDLDHFKVKSTSLFQPCIWAYQGNSELFLQSIS